MIVVAFSILLFLLSVATGGFVVVNTPITAGQPTPHLKSETSLSGDRGLSTWYDYRLTVAPDYSEHHMTAASRDYPRGTMLEVVRIMDYCTEPEQEFCYFRSLPIVFRVND